MAFKFSEPQSMPIEALLSDACDLNLVFDADERVPGHSFILKHWSGELKSLLAIECSDSSSSGPTVIPMPGTSKEDWLTAMRFAYPVVPAPDVTWDNCEVHLQADACCKLQQHTSLKCTTEAS
jgi:hypothetical protein